MLNILVTVYLILLLLRPQEFLPAFSGLPILHVLVLICMGLWVLAPNKRLDLPQFRLAAWFVIAALLSVGVAGWWGGTVPTLSYLTPIMMMFLLIATVARELQMLRRLMLVMIICSCIMVLHGHWQQADGIGWTGLQLLQGRITYVGIFSDPNDLGQLFVICLPFCFYLMRETSGFSKIVFVTAVGWLCYGIYMTDSRGTMLAALAVLGLEGKRRFGRLSIGLLGFAAVSALAAVTRLGTVSAQEQSANDRVESWYAGTQMFLFHPVFGVGMGNYTEHHWLTAHNSIVLPMAELGFFGFLPWIGILWFTGKMLHWLNSDVHSLTTPSHLGTAVIESERRAATALQDATISFAISAFFLSQSYKHLLFLIVALVMARFAHAATLFDAPRYGLLSELPKIAVVAASAILVMWVVMRALL